MTTATVTDITAAAPVSATAKPHSRRGNIAVWTAQAALAAFFVFAALPKLAGTAATVEAYNDIGYGNWFMYLTGAVELAGGIGLVVRRLSGPAALGLSATMVAATAVNIAYLEPAAAPVTLLLAGAFTAIAVYRREHTTWWINLARR